jgi:hypothetical protein
MGSEKPFDEVPFDAGVEADESSDPKKFIQQLAGKLGQSIRKYEGEIGQADLELEKFAVNSVLSATNTAEMDAEDQKDIIDKVKTSGLKNDVEPEGGAPDAAAPEGDMGGEALPEPEAPDAGADELEADVAESILEGGDADDIRYDRLSAPKEFGSKDDLEQPIGEPNEPDLKSLEEIGSFVESLKARLGNKMQESPVVEPQVKPKEAEPKRIKEKVAPFRRHRPSPQTQPKANA